MKIAFIQAFLAVLEDKKAEVFVIDEVGFGTSDLTHYAYSLIGTPVLFESQPMLAYNMSCIATLSTKGVEFL